MHNNTDILAKNVIEKLQEIDQKIDALIRERDMLKEEIQTLETEKNNIRSEIDQYLEELKKTKATICQ